MFCSIEVRASEHHHKEFLDFIAYGTPAENEDADFIAMFTKQFLLDEVDENDVRRQFMDPCLRMFDNIGEDDLEDHVFRALNTNTGDSLDHAIADLRGEIAQTGVVPADYESIAFLPIPGAKLSYKWALIARTTGARGVVLYAFEGGESVTDTNKLITEFIDKTLERLYTSQGQVVEDIEKALRSAPEMGLLASRICTALDRYRRDQPLRTPMTPPEKPQKDWNQKDIDRFQYYLADEREKLRKTLYKPQHCPKCGMDTGCMCPPPGGVYRPSEPPCEHLKVSRIPFSVARELNPTMPDNPTTRATQFWACDECKKIMLSRWVEGEKAPVYMGVDWAAGPDATAVVVTDGKKITHHLDLKTCHNTMPDSLRRKYAQKKFWGKTRAEEILRSGD
jgi:hypothetical protein